MEKGGGVYLSSGIGSSIQEKEWAMSTLRFNDGVNIDTDEPLRILHLKDGWYVVGEGYCIPVENRKEADETIMEMARKLK